MMGRSRNKAYSTSFEEYNLVYFVRGIQLSLLRRRNYGKYLVTPKFDGPVKGTSQNQV